MVEALPPVRKANLIDILRWLGCFAIVWNHSDYYSQLGRWKPGVDIGKTLLISWAMPFFYISTARFALSSSVHEISKKKIRKRVFGLIRLLGLCCLIYETWRILGSWVKQTTYVPFGLPLHAGILPAASKALDVFRTANTSPGYFLFQVLVIYLLSCLVAVALRVSQRTTSALLGIALVGLFSTSDSLGNHLTSYILLNKIAAGTMLAGFLYETLRPEDASATAQGASHWFLAAGSVLLLPGCVCLWLSFHPWHAQWTLSFLILTSLLFPFLGDSHRTLPELPWLQTLSTWGQRYSLGVFIWHAFFLRAILIILQLMFSSVLYPARLSVYFFINITGFLLAWGMTTKLYETIRWTVAL